MSLPPAFLDELRARTSLVSLIGRTVRLTKAGHEHKACCPFHNEKTASFTVSEAKGFYHCFSCGAHGDAIGWLTRHQAMPFMDAVRMLADEAGMPLPERSPAAAARAQRIEAVRPALEAAAALYQRAIEPAGFVREYLAQRGIDEALAAEFGLGYAPAAGNHLQALGADPDIMNAAGLTWRSEDAGERRSGLSFRNRLMVPICDGRGRIIGFGGRALPDAQGVTPEPKYKNSADSELFDKGRTLFNLHRAAPAARAARRLIAVEGYMDVIGLAAVGVAEAVAPMGTAITPAQLARMWQVDHCPILMFDGDSAGRKASLRACETALPALCPGNSLKIALLPDGDDPDDLRRRGGRDAIEAVIAAAMPVHDYLFQTVTGGDCATPEAIAGQWQRLAEMASAISDEETRAQYLSAWRARFDALYPPAPLTPADCGMKAILPNGGVEAKTLTAVERRRLQSVSEAWMGREVGRLAALNSGDPKQFSKLCFKIGLRIGAGLIDMTDAITALDDLAAAFDCDDQAIAAALNAGAGLPFDCAPDLLMMRCAGFPLTDLGNAERFFARHGRDFVFTTGKGWFGWDGRRYNKLDQEKDKVPSDVLAAVYKTVRLIQQEGQFVAATGWAEDAFADVPENKALKFMASYGGIPNLGGMNMIIQPPAEGLPFSEKLARHGRASESDTRLKCIANLAKRWMTRPLSDFDVDVLAINCLNGTVRLIRDPDGPRVELSPHSRDDNITKLAPVNYDPDAPAPLYDDFIEWAQPDPKIRRYLHQWGGYSATGDTSVHMLHLWYGRGRNGKSTLIDIWSHCMGDYGGSLGVETFLDQGIKKRGDAASEDIASLPGVRLLRASEPGEGAKLNSALIKYVTGGEPISVRANYGAMFTFKPQFKTTISFNDKPSIPETDDGIWGRVKLVNWTKNIMLEFWPDGRPKVDYDLPAKLRLEADGVFARMIAGALDWLRHGFIEPASVTAATREYREKSDPIARFLAACVRDAPGKRVQSSHLYALFEAWAKASGETGRGGSIWSNKAMSKGLEAKGYQNKVANGVQWLNIEKIKEVSDFLDHNGNVRPQPDQDAAGEPDDDDDPLSSF